MGFTCQHSRKDACRRSGRQRVKKTRKFFFPGLCLSCRTCYNVLGFQSIVQVLFYLSKVISNKAAQRELGGLVVLLCAYLAPLREKAILYDDLKKGRPE